VRHIATYRGEVKCRQGFAVENLKDKGILEDLGMHKRLILK
jgi:hypothetical protein